ncbi:MAG: InlB B-repeat-containing protein [Clostridia bacterium]|nr:InlB B-repeat-containing protein [Clostridia bacterium]
MKRVICIFLLTLLCVFPVLTSCSIGGSTLSFVSYGSYNPQDQSYNAGQSITKLPIISKIGFNFLGWSFKENSTEIIYLPISAGTTDVTLYAVYEINREAFIGGNAIDPSKNEAYHTTGYSNSILLYNNREVTQITITDNSSSIQTVGIHNCNGKTLDFVKNGSTYTFEPTIGDIIIDIKINSAESVEINFQIN